MINDTIFSYITQQEQAYRRPIDINRVWKWNMFDHIELSELYKYSQLSTGKDDFKPVKNITRPILNLQYRTEDIDVKDVQIYIDDPDRFHLSFLIKKYHDDVFVVENDLDSFFDKLNESRIDFGAGLSKKLAGPRPEVVPLQTIAFCDQTDMLSGPIGLKHFYSPDQLLEMSSVGWGNTLKGATITLKELISLSRDEKNESGEAASVKTPGRYIEIYEVHGNLPKRYFDDEDVSEEYETRLWVVAFYQKENSGDKEGVILYTEIESESPFKVVKRDDVHGRALGFGGAEELFESQVWVNYDMIRMQDMLDSASKTILKASGKNGAAIAQRSRIRDMDNNEIIDVGEGGDLSQVDMYPRNFALFEKSIQGWEAHAQQMGAANDALMGISPSSGTPFKLQELVTDNSKGTHDFRRGQFAKHIEEIYKDWIIPHIAKKITEGSRFLSTLDIEEMQYIADSLIRNESIKMKREFVLSNGGLAPAPEMVQQFEEQVREQFRKRGPKYFIEILKGEFKDPSICVKINVAGKQKNLNSMTDKIVNIFRFVFSNPQGFSQVMQLPGMAKSFNSILEFSGLSPVDFYGIEKLAMAQPQGQAQQGVPQDAVNALSTNATA